MVLMNYAGVKLGSSGTLRAVLKSTGVMGWWNNEIPKSKHQMTNKSQIPIFNDQNTRQVWNFETGDPPAGWGVQAKRGQF